MRINMTKEEIIGEDEVNVIVKKLWDEGASKGATIRALFAGGLSVKEITEVSTIKYNHVYNVCSAEIIKNNLEPDIIRAREGVTKKSQILSLLEEGKSITEVSKELGCLYNQVWQVAKAAGYTNKQKAAQNKKVEA